MIILNHQIRDADLKRILLLSGPAGSGKTTTVRTIAKEMGIDLIEWGEGADESTIGSGLGESPQIAISIIID
jgi:cell cycle checkpoint protein